MVLNRLASDSEDSSDDDAQISTAAAGLTGFATIRNVASVLKTSTVQQPAPKQDSQRSISSRYQAYDDAADDEDDNRASQCSARRAPARPCSSAAGVKRSNSKRSSQRSLHSLDSDSDSDTDDADSSTAWPTAASSQRSSSAAAAAASSSTTTAQGSAAEATADHAAAAAAACNTAAGSAAEHEEEEELDIAVHNVSATPDGVELMPFQPEFRHLGRYEPLQLEGGGQLNAAAARYLMPHQRTALHFAWSLLQNRKGGILVSFADTRLHCMHAAVVLGGAELVIQ
jgi:hypothetical protein